MPVESKMAFPGPNASPNDIIAYRDRVFDHYSPLRRQEEARWAAAMHYFIDNQWLEFFRSGAIPMVGRYGLRIQASMQDGMPRPVTNILTPAIEQVLVNFAKRMFIPKAYAGTNSPRDISVAKRMQDVLHYLSERKLDWPSKRQLAGFFLTSSGTACLRSGWDSGYLNTKPILSPLGRECTQCGGWFSE